MKRHGRRRKAYVVNLANDAVWRRELEQALKRASARFERLAALERGELVAKVVPVKKTWVPGHWRDPHDRMIAVRKEQPIVRSPRLKVLAGGKS